MNARAVICLSRAKRSSILGAYAHIEYIEWDED